MSERTTLGESRANARKPDIKYCKRMRIIAVDDVDNVRPDHPMAVQPARLLCAAIHESFPAPKRLNKQNLR
jgi:hypothetical protein